MMQGVIYRPLTPITFLERSARVFPDRAAVIDGELRLTYSEFLDGAHRLAASLQELGIKLGDCVAFLALNGEPLLTAHYGVPMSGGVLVAMNTRLSRNEIVHILRETEAKVLFIDPSLVSDLNDIPAECRVITLQESKDGGRSREIQR